MKFLSVLVQRIVLAGLFLFGWYLVSSRVPAFVLPGPDAVFRAFLSLLSSSTFWKDVLDTARRVISGFVLAAVVGSVLGVVFGSSKALATFFAPVISVLNSVSSAIWQFSPLSGSAFRMPARLRLYLWLPCRLFSPMSGKEPNRSTGNILNWRKVSG